MIKILLLIFMAYIACKYWDQVKVIAAAIFTIIFSILCVSIMFMYNRLRTWCIIKK